MPQRIVSLVPSHTESLHDLGLANRVVGRTRFCIAPSPWVDSIPSVGGTKDASLEKILALAPDLVVVDKDENPLPLVQALQDEGVPVLHSEIDTVADAAAFLCKLGEVCGVKETAENAALAIEHALAKQAGPSIPVWCPIWYQPWMTFNHTAYPSAMLAAAGLDNVFATQAGPKYFQVEPHDVAGTQARYTLLPTEPFPFHKKRGSLDLAGLGEVGKEERVHIIDGEALTWFGTRTARSLAQLRDFAQSLR